ncbi:CHAT domain-containing protein [Streptomyces beigongshangae]|uniref:CHAT domain-containing protein n=1 Tax=Streptomyces beigongshangae TaxID=2841597 RepID=UPI001C852303|nr:CHAT domain-containing protein [Streptomyces sp. REN17]
MFDQSFYERYEHAGRQRARSVWHAGLGSEELAALQAAHLDALEQEKRSAVAAVREESRKAIRDVDERAEQLEIRLSGIGADQAALQADIEACRGRIRAAAANMSDIEHLTAEVQGHHVRRKQMILTLAGAVETVMFQYGLHEESGYRDETSDFLLTLVSAVTVTAAGILCPFLAGMWARTGRRQRMYAIGAAVVVAVSVLVTVLAARVLATLPGTYFLTGNGEWAVHALLLLLLSGYAFFVGNVHQLSSLVVQLKDARERLAGLRKAEAELAFARKKAKRASKDIPQLKQAELARFTEREELVAARFEVAARAFTAGVVTEARALTAGARPELTGAAPAARAVNRKALDTSFVLSRPVERLLVADHPTQVAPGDRVNAVMRIISRGSTVQFTGSTPIKDIDIPAQGVDVLLTVQAREGLFALGSLSQVLHVPQYGDSEPVLFEFEARRIGMLRATATAWVGGTYVGELSLEISAESGARSTPTTSKGAPIGRLVPAPGEVTLQLKRLEGRYQFQVLTPETYYDMEPMGPEAGLDDSIQRTLQRLETLAGRTQPDRVQSSLLRAMGVTLWEQLVPAPVKEQFWASRDSISAFSIATDHDVIPWELLYPLSRGRDEGFLVEQFPVARRVYGQARTSSISIARSAFVLPATSPQGAKQEILDVNRRLAQTLRIAPGEVLRDAEDLLEWIEQGAPGLLHFACHNTFQADQGGSCVAMEGGDFTPDLLTPAVPVRGLEAHSPLVFFNACRSAGATYQYTQLMGWASQFMAAGAGAFVGTLWGVPSNRAVEFSETFYESFVGERQSLGRAVMTARRKVQSSTDPTWLAYTVYGDPGTTIV